MVKGKRLTLNSRLGPEVRVTTSVHLFLSLVRNYCKNPTFVTTSR